MIDYNNGGYPPKIQSLVTNYERMNTHTPTANEVNFVGHHRLTFIKINVATQIASNRNPSLFRPCAMQCIT